MQVTVRGECSCGAGRGSLSARLGPHGWPEKLRLGPGQCKLETRPGGTPGPAVPCISDFGIRDQVDLVNVQRFHLNSAQKNAKRGICTPCPKHPFPVRAVVCSWRPWRPGSQGLLSGASRRRRCQWHGQRVSSPGGNPTRASSELAPWRDLDGLEIHVILPQP